MKKSIKVKARATKLEPVSKAKRLKVFNTLKEFYFHSFVTTSRHTRIMGELVALAAIAAGKEWEP